MSQKTAWKTTQTKDGKTVLLDWFYATNPLYVRCHDEWTWVECPIEEAREFWRLNWDFHYGDGDPRYHSGRLGPSGGM